MLEAWQRAGIWRLSASQLDQAAEVTTFDVMQARQLWLRAAPPQYVDLLDAVQEAV